jgi:hypothetical protein
LGTLLTSATKHVKYPEEKQINALIYRVFMLLFPGIRDSSRALASIFLDMLHLEPSPAELQETLRLEISALKGLAKIQQGEDYWSTRGLDQALLLDSSVKESLRLSSLKSNGPELKVRSVALILLEKSCKNAGNTHRIIPPPGYFLERSNPARQLCPSASRNFNRISPISRSSRSRILL